MAPGKREISKLRLLELEKELENRGLDASGSKAEMIDRLRLAMSIEDQTGQTADQTIQPTSAEIDLAPQIGLNPAGSALPEMSPEMENPQVLIAKLKLLKEKQALDEQRLRVESRTQQIELEMRLVEISGGSVDESVLEPLRINSVDSNRDPVRSASISDALCAQMQRTLMPVSELKPFSGNILDYRCFIKSFEARVGCRTTDPTELLHYLEQFTTHVPNQIVRSCLYLGQGGYAEARKLLDARFGNTYKVAEQYLDRIRAWPRIQTGDLAGLDRLFLFLTEVKNVMFELPTCELDHPRTIRAVLGKLPGMLQDRFLRLADSRQGQHETVTFADLVSLLETEVRVRSNPVFAIDRVGGEGVPPSNSAYHSDNRPTRHRVNAVSVGGEGKCAFCGGNHLVGACSELKQKPLENRMKVLRDNRLCFRCIRPGHVAKWCRQRETCESCGGQHASLLHIATGPPRTQSAVGTSGGSQTDTENTDVIVSARVSVGDDRGSVALMPIIPVRVIGAAGKEVNTYAFLDSGSSGTFITKGLAQRLGQPQKHTNVVIETVNESQREITSTVVEGIRIGSVQDDALHALPPAFTLDTLPVRVEDKCRTGDLSEWCHLKDISLNEVGDPNVEILVGANAPHLLVSEEVRSPPVPGGPYGVKSALGWYVIGSVKKGGAHRLSRQIVNFLKIVESPVTKVETGEAAMFEKLYEQDFGGLSDEGQDFSVEEREWLRDVKSKTRKDAEGHYEIGLPRVEVEKIPDSKPQAARRLQTLKQRFRKDPEYFEAYSSVIQSLLDEGYAELVPPGEIFNQETWVLPHHAVRHPEKEKLRVVFDCAAKSQGVALNDLLKKGPHLSNPLLGVLLRFREGRVAFTCDIQAMFHQVRLPKQDSDLFRFLWFKDNDLDGEVMTYRMKSHIFGAVSSPSVASLALRECAEMGKCQFPEAAEALERRTYVDDGLCVADSVDQAVKIATDLKSLCKGGGFSMKKFASNSAEFLKRIPVEDRGKNVKDLDLDKDGLLSERTLGLKWSVCDDTFEFQFTDKAKPATRRGILSTVSSIFDPLGIIAPVTLTGKMLLQKLCASQCGWDGAIPSELRSQWDDWLKQARDIDRVKIPRCIMGLAGEVLSTQLHVFSDASEKGYSAVGYMRREVMGPDGQVRFEVNFLMGKSRVSPRRFVSVPRLELAAAVTAVKLKLLLERELDSNFDSCHLWSDSMIVIQYIRNRTTRFKTYVANRLSYIHDHSAVGDWSHVPSGINPADIGSRGSHPRDLALWLEGPKFLTGDKDCWPKEPAVTVQLPVSEMKKSVPVAIVNVSGPGESPSDRLLQYYSDFFRLKKAVAWFRRLSRILGSGEYRRLRSGLRSRRVPSSVGLTVAEVRDAETAILRYVQKTAVPESLIGADEAGFVCVNRGSPLSKLRPCMRNGILVVGGRLGNSPSISASAKHPIILPRNHHVTQLVIREAHQSVGHEGRDHTLWRLRERYRVLGASPEIRRMIRSCVTCRKANARPSPPLMADLPCDRVTADSPPFAVCGIDLFGDFYVRQGRSERKRYGLICICMATRAVHLEVLDSLRTDSLINALRRVMARRGQIHILRSDMGSNMLSAADGGLKRAIKDLDKAGLQRASLKLGIEWIFNPPTGSHCGGSWERAIRSCRKIWRSMPAQTIDEESLNTLFCEIEAVLNSRPLNYVSTDADNLEPLTPSHLLLLRGSVSAPPGDFDESESFSRQRWRRVQYLADQFWSRWRREYLPTLQKRQKWTVRGENMKLGDIVLLSESSERGRWKMGRIIAVFPSQDGIVRKVTVRVGTSTLLRPVHKLVLLHSEKDV